MVALASPKDRVNCWPPLGARCAEERRAPKQETRSPPQFSNKNVPTARAPISPTGIHHPSTSWRAEKSSQGSQSFLRFPGVLVVHLSETSDLLLSDDRAIGAVLLAEPVLRMRVKKTPYFRVLHSNGPVKVPVRFIANHAPVVSGVSQFLGLEAADLLSEAAHTLKRAQRRQLRLRARSGIHMWIEALPAA